ncbi:MAG: energy transducer TonB [Pseudomonadota bacterium]
MRIFLAILLASWVAACATTTAPETRVSISSDPPGATARLIGGYPKFAALGQCQTPCELTFQRTWGEIYDYSVVLEKENYLAVELRGYEGEATPDGTKLHGELMTLAAAWNLENKEQAQKDAAALQSCLNAAASPLPTDFEPIPCRRVPPSFPVGVDVSGHCDMDFTIKADGKPDEIDIVSCTDDRFARASERALGQWLYIPARRDGLPVDRPAMKVRITFRLE